MTSDLILILGIVLLVILFLLIGRGWMDGRRVGRGEGPKWQRPGRPQRDEPARPRLRKRERIGCGRGGKREKREHDKREGGKPDRAPEK